MTYISKIKEITLYTVGDSNSLATWSNVPFLFAKALINKGIKVNRVNISSNKKIEYYYNKYILRLFFIFYKDHYYSYERSIINRFLTTIKIKRSSKLYPNSQLNIFMSLSFYHKWNKKPSILFGDWTYEYIIKERQRRKPYWFENNYIKFQSNSINCADMVVSLFPKCCEYIKKTHENSNIVYLNQNVVNNCSNIIPSEKLIDHKYKKQNLLFIGGGRYQESAKTIIDAFIKLKKKKRNLHLDIIGLPANFNPNKDYSHIQDIKFHGYLNKSIEKERELYYSILQKATIYINTTPQWAAYSSTIESMYFYTPIIISKYDDFTAEFGETIPFGLYSKNNSELLMQKIDYILNNEAQYKTLAIAAHDAVKQYTWNNYIDLLLNRIEKGI